MICSKCGRDKPSSEFRPQRRACTDCERIAESNRYAAKHKDDPPVVGVDGSPHCAAARPYPAVWAEPMPKNHRHGPPSTRGARRKHGHKASQGIENPRRTAMIWRILAAVAALTFAWPASAKDELTNGCAPFAVALRLAMAQYGEAPAWIATLSNGVVITLTVNPKTGTWTMWGQRNPESMCLMTGGADWSAAPDAIKNVAPPGTPS